MCSQELNTNVYSRLSRYAPSTGRMQGENFLTENLCDLLERITKFDRNSAEALVKEVLLGNSADSGFLHRISSAKNLEWQTQFYCRIEGGYGYVDICLLADEQVVLAIENKVTAGFTAHTIDEKAGTPKLFEQLPFYDRWLVNTYPGAALVLLTHKTEPPPGFSIEQASPSSPYLFRCVIRHTCRWTALYKWLSGWIANSDSVTDKVDDLLARGLTREFLQYLEEINMSTIEMNDNDLHLLAAFFEQDIWKKIRQLSSSARSLAKNILPSVSGQPNRVPEIGAGQDTQIFWDWAYCYERHLLWYVGWGFSGPKGLSQLRIHFPRNIQPFVLVTSERAEITVPVSEHDGLKRQGWEIYQSPGQRTRFLKITAIETLLDGKRIFSESYQDWLSNTLGEAARILELAHATPHT